MSFELAGATNLRVRATRNGSSLWTETVSAVGEYNGFQPMPYIVGHRVVAGELHIQVDTIHPKGGELIRQLEHAFGPRGHLWTR